MPRKIDPNKAKELLSTVEIVEELMDLYNLNTDDMGVLRDLLIAIDTVIAPADIEKKAKLIKALGAILEVISDRKASFVKEG